MDTCAPGPLPSGSQFRFNGAMAFQPWIPDDDAMFVLAEMMLQWSHDLSAVDTSKRFTQNSRILDKLQWSPDLSAMDSSQPAGFTSGADGASMEQ